MKERLTSIIAIVLLVVLVGMSYWYSIKAEREANLHLSDLEQPDFIAHDIAITKFNADGSAKAKVFAEKVEHYSNGEANATAPRYYSLNPAEPQVRAQSDSAKMNNGGEVIHFYDNVDIQQEASGKNPASRVQTSQLDAFPDTDTYSSDKPVKLTRGNDVSNGIGMDFDNVERTFKLRSRVSTVLQPKTVRQVERKK